MIVGFSLHDSNDDDDGLKVTKSDFRKKKQFFKAAKNKTFLTSQLRQPKFHEKRSNPFDLG